MHTTSRESDEGFSLVEVIVALLILGIVAASSLWFFINGMQTSSNIQRQQTAVSIANSAMEESFIHNPKTDSGTGVSGLVIGRSYSDVTAAYNYMGPGIGNLDIINLADQYPLYDPAGGTALLPVAETVTRVGIDYAVYTLVGACYRQSSVLGAEQNCTQAAGFPTAEPSAAYADANGIVRLIRVMVVVTWQDINGECNGRCHYEVSTLVDPSDDLQWNVVVDPIAVDDNFNVTVNDSASEIRVLNNDTYGTINGYPVRVLSGLSPAAGTLGSETSGGAIPYTPLDWRNNGGVWHSGIFYFTYRLTDARGQQSEATVAVNVQPDSSDDDFEVYANASTVLNVTGNDLGSPAVVVIDSPPSRGSVTVSGTTVTYHNTSAGEDSFTYYYRDGSDQVSPPATVEIDAQALTASDVAVPVAYRTDPNPNAGWVDVTDALRNGVSGADVTILNAPSPASGAPAGGSLRVDGAPYTGGTVRGSLIEFQPPANGVGEWTFDFRLEVSGAVSQPAEATMRVDPFLLQDDYAGGLKRGYREFTINLGGNDLPSSWPSSSGITFTHGVMNRPTYLNTSRCGTFQTVTEADKAAGQIRIVTPNSSQAGCYFSYQLSANGQTASATVYFDVVN